jgi:uncharacterized protein with HEPN domain
MIKDNLVYLKHIRDSINKIYLYTGNITLEVFFENSMIHDAVIRQFEIIGEATNNITNDFRLKYETVPWKNMIALRNKVIHGYFGVNLNIIWDAVKEELPPLKKSIDEIIKNETPKSPLGI